MLVYRNPEKRPIPEHLKAQSQIAPKKKQRVLVINHDLLCSEYQYSMLSAMSLAPALVDKEQVQVLVLGTGAGRLPMFLRSQLGDKLQELVTVEISEHMIHVSLKSLTHRLLRPTLASRKTRSSSRSSPTLTNT